MGALNTAPVQRQRSSGTEARGGAPIGDPALLRMRTKKGCTGSPCTPRAAEPLSTRIRCDPDIQDALARRWECELSRDFQWFRLLGHGLYDKSVVGDLARGPCSHKVCDVNF